MGGGARSAAYRQLLADLSQRHLVVPEGDEHVATGACVQAAAVLHETTPDAVAEAWGLATGEVVEPDGRVDAEAVRAQYAVVIENA